MNILSVSNLARHGREDLLFSDVTLGLDEGEKAALIDIINDMDALGKGRPGYVL